jgi:DNA gyrase subunit A
MEVVRPESHLVTVTDGGYAKRTSVSEWRTQGRNTYGVTAMKLVEERGSLVGALICEASDELYAIASNGIVIRTRVDQVRATGRATMGVSLMDLSGDDGIVGVARSADLKDDEELEGTGLAGADVDPSGGQIAEPEDGSEVADVGGRSDHDDVAPEES